MELVEQLISQVAPHRCIVCKIPGSLLCEACENSCVPFVAERCYSCHASTRQSSVCASCRKKTGLDHVWVRTHYESTAKELIQNLKFARAKAGAKIIAGAINDVLPDLPDSVVVAHIPTANSRVRQRGYDQADLIARQLSRLRGWKHQRLLSRIGSSRQVGSSRKERFEHLQKALIPRAKDLKGYHILLIDDVVTTGATIEAAAKALKQSGAKKIDAAIFAQP